MADDDRQRELRDEWARLAAETADGELSADEIEDKMKRKGALRAEMERLGIGPISDFHQATTSRDPG